MSDNTTQTAICPCDTFVHPQVIFNSPGRNVLAYRSGDYITFRHALLLSRPDEIELQNWRPSAKGDLALQMVEWWAYLADILTFYNERIANQAYLRTADLAGKLAEADSYPGLSSTPRDWRKRNAGRADEQANPVYAAAGLPHPEQARPRQTAPDIRTRCRHPDLFS